MIPLSERNAARTRHHSPESVPCVINSYKLHADKRVHEWASH